MIPVGFVRKYLRTWGQCFEENIWNTLWPCNMSLWSDAQHLFHQWSKSICGIFNGRCTSLKSQDLILAQINGPILVTETSIFKAFKSGIKICNFVYIWLYQRPRVSSPKNRKYTECGKSLNSCAFCFQNYCINLESNERSRKDGKWKKCFFSRPCSWNITQTIKFFNISCRGPIKFYACMNLTTQAPMTAFS